MDGRGNRGNRGNSQYTFAGILFISPGSNLIIERIIFWWRVKNKQRQIVKEVMFLYRQDRFAAIYL